MERATKLLKLKILICCLAETNKELDKDLKGEVRVAIELLNLIV